MLVVLDAATGAETVRIQIEGPVRQPVLALDDGVVIVSDRGVLTRTGLDGILQWRFETKDDVIAPPSLADGRIVVTTKKGVVHVLKY